MITIRPAQINALPALVELAEHFDLDSEDMRPEDFTVAKDKGQIVGLVQLKKHPDCQELCSLGVKEEYQKTGLGARLVKKVIKQASKDLYLATTRPSYFQKFGFAPVTLYPQSMVKKEEWCVGCKNKNRCTIMRWQKKSEFLNPKF